MIITYDELKKDLEGFYIRLQKARDKLAALPTTTETWQERKKLFEKKRVLLSEIQHVRKLIEIGNESLFMVGKVLTFKGGYL